MKFPDFPSYKGHWHAVSINPISHSHEEITIAIVAIGDNGESLVKEAISDELYDVVFKKTGLRNIVKVVRESIENHLKDNSDMSKWNAPFQGVKLLESKESADDSLEDIAKQGLRFSSFLYGLTIKKDGQ